MTLLGCAPEMSFNLYPRLIDDRPNNRRNTDGATKLG